MELLHDAFLYLLAAVIAVPIANRLGLGSVLGYLVAGVIIGPVLSLVGAETQDLKHFAEFGVVMMLFLIGLELRPAMLWQMKAKVLGLGGLQVLVTTAAISQIAMYLGLEWQSALSLGMILGLSSTAIVLQTLKEKGWMKSVGGKSSLAVLLFQDMAVIPMLIILPLLSITGVIGDGGEAAHKSGALLHGLDDWLKVVIIFGAILGIVLAGRFAIQPLFRFIAHAKLRETFTAAALLLVIGTAVLMDAIGLSPALGTFLAGVVLSTNEYRHELESDIEPFKGLLLGLFFITVGAGMDFGLLFEEFFLILGIALGLMALKFVLLYALSFLFRLPNNDRWLVSLGLAQAGEFAFVLFGLASLSGALSHELEQIMVLVVTFSMLLTPALFIFYERMILARTKIEPVGQADHIDEHGVAVIAGVGRFGQVVARMMMTNGFQPVILDHDPNLIKQVAKFGIKTFYGDATRADLLHASGLDEAKLFVAALNNKDSQNAIVEHVAKHYPHVRIIARATDRHHIYELEQLGAHEVVRELFDSSIQAGKLALIELGIPPIAAERKARAFMRHDMETVAKMREHWSPDGSNQKYTDILRAQTAQLYEVMKADMDELANDDNAAQEK